jgi:hypothetical protein
MAKRLTALGGVFLLTMALLLAVTSPVAAGDRCFGVQGSATTFFDPDIGGFTGTADFKVGGKHMEVDATAFADVLGLTPRPNGWLTAAGGHSLDFGYYGTVATTDVVILVPTGDNTFNLRSRLTVTDGGSGKLHILPHSTLDLNTFSASWEMRGEICFDG